MFVDRKAHTKKSVVFGGVSLMFTSDEVIMEIMIADSNVCTVRIENHHHAEYFQFVQAAGQVWLQNSNKLKICIVLGKRGRSRFLF